MMVKKHINLACLPSSDFPTKFNLWLKIYLNSNDSYLVEKADINDQIIKIDIILDRLNNSAKNLLEHIKEIASNLGSEFNQYESNENDVGCSLQLKKTRIIYEFLIDVNSLLYELKTCTELMMKFAIQVYYPCCYQQIEKDKERFKKFKKEIITLFETQYKSRENWFCLLTNYRNKHIHQFSSWVALDVSCAEPDNWQLLIIRNHKTVKDALTTEKINSILQNFCQYSKWLEKHLIDKNNETNNNTKNQTF